jgi:hypothetical protein
MQRRLAWESAEVLPTDLEGPQLVVPVVGDHDLEWDRTFERVLATREGEASGETWWGTATFDHEPRAVAVENVEEGSEAALRTYLDECVEAAELLLIEETDRAREAQQRREDQRREAAEQALRMRERFRGERDD